MLAGNGQTRDTVKIRNPYLEDNTSWRRGNLHAHTARSDGDRQPQELIDVYAALGYDFLMISDHDMIVDPAEFDARGMALISGNEVTINGPHILHIDAKVLVAPDADRQRVLDKIGQDSAFAVVAHPNWERHFNHCPQEGLEAWRGYLGMEIYNGLVRSHPGSPLATDRWDRLLGSGRRVWGFANDDAHHVGDEGIAWNMVQCEVREAPALLSAMQAGRFYASTGVRIESAHVCGHTIHIRTRDAQRIVALADYSRRLGHVDGNEMMLEVLEAPKCAYVRFECYGPGESMAWTQPFFIEH